MKIKYSPQGTNVQYKVVDETVYIKVQDKISKVDFSNLEDGKLEPSTIDYISGAEKINEELTVTIIQPLDKDGNEVPALGEFETEEYEEIEFEWKSWGEIEREENRLSESDMNTLAIFELAQQIENLKGGA